MGDRRLRVSFENQLAKTPRELDPERPQAEGLRIVRSTVDLVSDPKDGWRVQPIWVEPCEQRSHPSG